MPEPLITGLRVLLFASSPHVRKQCLPRLRLPPLWHKGSATLGGSALLDGVCVPTGSALPWRLSGFTDPAPHMASGTVHWGTDV